MMNIFNETEEERNKKALSLLDRAMSYYHNGIYVYPVYPESTIRQEYDLCKCLKTPPIWEEVWEGKTQNEDDIRNFKWKDAVNVYAVAGKNGIRVLSIQTENDRLLDTALYLLNLPFDYFWADSNYIIVECPDDSIGNFNSESDGIKLIWQGYYILPTFTFHCPHFPYKHGKPLHVEKDKLINCIETLRREKNNKSKELTKIVNKEKEKWKKLNYQVPYTPKIQTVKKPLLTNIADTLLEWFRLIGALLAIGFVIFLLVMVTGWLFRGCQNTNPDNYDYDPGIVRRQ